MEGVLEKPTDAFAEPRHRDDTNADVLPAQRSKEKAVATSETKKEKAISKRKQRKLDQLAKKRASQELRSETLAGLKETRLSAEHAALLRASQSMYRTKKQKLAFAQQRFAMGIPLTEEEEQLRKKPKKRREEEEENQTSTPQVVLNPADRPIPVLGPAREPAPAPRPTKVAEPASAAKASDTAAAQAKQEPAEGARDTMDDEPKKVALSPQRLQPVRLERREEIDEQRSKLPAVLMEQEAIEMCMDNDVMLVCGDTGCGKSTQVPQFLFEAGLCDGGRYLIGVTQPRRVAAISVSQRVGDELNKPELVGYQVRYDSSHCGKEMCIKFMTDGILLREVQSDFLCQKYSCIIIDEAHERGVNCDILIGLLSRAVARRRKMYEEALAKNGGNIERVDVAPPLRLIVMSATLRLCDFTENRQLFPSPPPVLRIDARTFPVTAHFARVTEEDYIKAAKKTVLKIHKKLPPGTILVFVTGRHEVHRLCKLLKEAVLKKEDPDKDEKKDEEDDKGDQGPREFLDASDDEGGADDDEEFGPPETADMEVPEAPKAAEGAEEGEQKKGKKGKKRKAAQGDAAAASESNKESAAPEKAGKKKRKGKAGSKAAEEQAQPEEQAEQAEAAAAVQEEPEFDYALDPEETVVVLDSELPTNTKMTEDQKDEAAKNERKANMKKLDKSRTAGGVFKGAGFNEGPLHVLPLYAQLPARAQMAPFGPCPEGKRVVVISTNVAETSVTLPNVRYVIDAGHEKRRKYRAASGISSFIIDKISKASADQRAGRAGRLGPGHAYRLYSSAVYENYFHQFAPIPMLHTPMDPVLLLLAFLGVPRLDVFPWPTPPGADSVKAAVRRLRALGAIKEDGKERPSATSAVKCTQLGYRLASLPVAPRYAKILLTAVTASEGMQGGGIVGHACALVAALSVGNIACWESVAHEDDAAQSGGLENELLRVQREAQALLRKVQEKQAPKWSTLKDDMEGLLWLMGGYSWAVAKSEQAAESFCESNRVNFRQIGEAHSLMQQLATLIKQRVALEEVGIKLMTPLRLMPPSPEQTMKLKECIVDGLVDRVAVACPELGKAAYVCADLGREVPVFVHNSSNIFRNRPRPSVLAFNEIISSSGPPCKPFMRDCIGVDPTLLARRAAASDCPLLRLGDFLPLPAPRYLGEQDRVLAFASPKYAPLDYGLPTVEVSVPDDNIFRYKVFAKALMEGEVIRGFPPAQNALLAKPMILLTAPTNPRVAGLIGPLWQNKVGSREELVRHWERDIHFLLDGYLKWVQPSQHAAIKEAWPPCKTAKA